MSYNDFIYKPPENVDEPIKATLGVKFAQDTYLLKSFLDQHGIEYKLEDLEDGPFGLHYRIPKKDISQ